jgi:predicted nuclease of predicted toxin-antitoxin system
VKDLKEMMKLLLDEQLPKSIAKAFPPSVEVSTVQSLGWSGTKNGALLKLAQKNDFLALLSADKNIVTQHNEKKRIKDTH